MQKSLGTGHVPSDRIIAAIDSVLGTKWPWEFPDDRLAPLETYWDSSDLRKMMGGGWMEFNLADRVICSLHLPMLWHDKLLDLYTEVNLSTKQSRVRNAPKSMRKCERVGCSNTFVPRKGGIPQRYCSPACRLAGWKKRSGRTSTQPAGPGRKLFITHCKNGHERTEENTRIEANGVRRCRICIRESDRKGYQRHREQRLAEKRERDRRRRAA